MNQYIVDSFNSVIVKIEENIAIKTEIIDADVLNETISLADLTADHVKVKEEMCFIKPEPVSTPSGSGEGCLPNDSENVTIKTVAIDSNEASLQTDNEGNIVKFYEGETSFIKPEPNSGPSGSVESNLWSELPGKAKRFACPKCDKTFTLRHHLNSHVEGVHMKSKKYVCQGCSYSSFYQGNLKKHVDAVHKNLKEFVCGECDRGFSLLDGLKKHLEAVHSKLKRFVCSECDRAFSRREDLKLHIDAVHRQCRKFSCGECDRTFTHQGNMKRHLDAIHRKIKYICGQCDRSFSLKNSLKNHLNVVHKT